MEFLVFLQNEVNLLDSNSPPFAPKIQKITFPILISSLKQKKSGKTQKSRLFLSASAVLALHSLLSKKRLLLENP